MLSTSIRKKATMQTAFPVDRAQVRLHKKKSVGEIQEERINHLSLG